jgi:magnesium transporter
VNPLALEMSQALVLGSPNKAALAVERSSPQQLAELLTELSPEASQVLLAHLVPLAGASALGLLDPETGAQLIERIGAQRAAVLLRRLDDETSARLRRELDSTTRTVVERLLEYRPDQAGGRMDPHAPATSAGATVEHALDLVRQAADSALHYQYVLDDEHRLVGVVSMRELMVASPTTLVSTIMTCAPERLLAHDPLSSVVVNPGWRRTPAMPVVDEENRFLGVVRYSIFRAIEAELGQSQSGPEGSKTAVALAELLWIGSSAMGKMTKGALLGGKQGREES